MTRSRRLRRFFMRSTRSSFVPPSPNSRSNTTLGLFSTGSGVVGDCHDTVFMYAQLYPASHWPPSTRSISDEINLHRRQHRVLAELRRGDLIGGRREPDVCAFGLLRMHAGEPRCARARVFAVAVAERFPLFLREAADDRQAIAIRRQRRENRRELELRARTLRRPEIEGVVHRDAVRHVDESHACHGRCGALQRRRKCRHHRIEQRKRKRRAHASQERAPR